MEQISFLHKQPLQVYTLKSCVFTGHRGLGADFSEEALILAVEGVIARGVTDFYNGMAVGFDLAAAEVVLKLKKKYPQIRLIACIPCYNQEKHYDDKDKKRYAKLVKKADERVQLADEYYTGCMLVRDKYMVERADIMITYCKRNTGGTAYTVRHFKKVRPGREIIFL